MSFLILYCIVLLMKNTVYRICGDGMLLAIYIVLSTLTIRLTPNLQITFSGLSVIMAIVLYGWGDGILIALLGSFVAQLRSIYGLTITTPLWMVPPILRAVVFGFIYHLYLKRNIKLQDKKTLFFIYVVISGLATTIANTGAIFLDAYISYYSVTMGVIEAVFRFVSSIFSNIAIAGVSLPIIYSLQHAGLIHERLPKEEIKTN